MNDSDVPTENENHLNFESNGEETFGTLLIEEETQPMRLTEEIPTLSSSVSEAVTGAFNQTFDQTILKRKHKNEKMMILPNVNLWMKPDLTNSLATKTQTKSLVSNPVRKSLLELGYNPPPDSKCVTPVSKKNICKVMVDMLRKGKYPDVMVRIGKKRYPCHMCILQSFSDFFKEFPVGQEIVLSEDLVSDKVFESIYRWMLTDVSLIPYDRLVEIFHASRVLNIPELTKVGWSYFDCAHDHLREDQAFALYWQARKYKLNDLQNALLQRITKYFLALVASKEFLQMEADEVERLLSCNNIGINTEVEVFLSALRWVGHDRDTREVHLEKLLNCVRFGAIPAWYLLQIQNKSICGGQIDWIAEKDFVINMVRRAMIYSVAHQHYAGNPENFLQWLNEEGLDRINERQYVFDKGCVYHHRLRCPHMHLVTYRMFENYLNEVEIMGRDHWRCVEHDMPEEPCTCMTKLIISSDK